MVAIGHADGGNGSGTRQVHDTCCVDAALTLAELFVAAFSGVRCDLHPAMSAHGQVDEIVSLTTGRDANDVWQRV